VFKLLGGAREKENENKSRAGSCGLDEEEIRAVSLARFTRTSAKPHPDGWAPGGKAYGIE